MNFQTTLGLLLWLSLAADSKLEFGNSVDNVENLIQYEYKYKVDDGKRKGPVMDRWERRLGDFVKGAYSVVEPDGSVRTVDYEVDGDHGYKAITRHTRPATEYLSFQQLNKAEDIFPVASPSPVLAIATTQEERITPPVQQPDGSENIFNYHARPPYINKRESISEHKTAASSNLGSAMLNSSPRTPANYNVPFSKALIYYKRPAGKIHPNAKLPQNIFDIDTLLPSQPVWMKFMYHNGITDVVTRRPASVIQSTPVKRNSRLVKRFRSMDEVYA